MDAQERDEVRCGLATEALRSWGVLKLRATGASMLPTLWPGDIVTIRSVIPEQVEPGEIVLYTRHGRFLIHRIVGKDLTAEAPFLVTRGDCMPENDPRIGRSELLGRVTEVRRSGSVFSPSRKLSPLHRILAWLFCHWNLFRRLGLRIRACRDEGESQLEASLIRAAQ
jgi:signal peptidase I